MTDRPVRDPALEHARALADATRHRIFRYIAAASEPVTVRELTDLLAVNHNTVRQHLAKLVRAGLVTEDREARTEPGRPRLVYRVDTAAVERWGEPGPYARLSLLLLEMVRTGGSARDVGRRVGERDGAAASDPASAVALIEDDARRQGFSPRRDPAGGLDLVLEDCPYAEAASADAATVCALHLGLAEGLAAAAGHVEVTGLEPKNPRRAGCRLHLR